MLKRAFLVGLIGVLVGALFWSMPAVRPAAADEGCTPIDPANITMVRGTIDGDTMTWEENGGSAIEFYATFPTTHAMFLRWDWYHGHAGWPVVYVTSGAGATGDIYLNWYQEIGVGPTSVWYWRDRGFNTQPTTLSSAYFTFIMAYGHQVRNVQICGEQGPAPRYASTPEIGETLDIGHASPGRPATNAEVLHMANIGDAPLIISSVEVTGPGSGVFTVNSPQATVQLAPQAAQYVSITCDAPDTAAYEATLTVSTNDPAAATVAYPITCNSGGEGPPDGSYMMPILPHERDPDLPELYPVRSFTDAMRRADTSPYGDSVVVFSKVPGVNVHVAAAGEVVSVTNLAGTFCLDTRSQQKQDFDEITPGGTIVLPEMSGRCMLFVPKGWDNSLALITPIRWAGLERENASLIEVAQDDGRSMIYVVGEPLVKAGDKLAAGCILGATFRWKEYTSQFQDTVQGIALIQGRDAQGTPFYLPPALTQIPTDSPCVLRTSDCPLVNNPNFENEASGWRREKDARGHVAFMDVTGGLVPTGRTFSLPMRLDTAATYKIVVRYRMTRMIPMAFSVRLGQSPPVRVYSSSPSIDTMVYQSPAQTWLPDGPGSDLYTLELFADEQGLVADPNVTVDGICVTDAEQETLLSKCVLGDPDLNHDFGASPWVAGDMVMSVGGMVVMNDSGWMEQSLTLSPKADGSPQEYRVWTEYRRGGSLPQEGHSIGLSWQWGSASGTFPAVTDRTWKRAKSAVFAVAAKTSANLRIAASGSHTNENAHITWVCISTADGAPVPGADDIKDEVACRLCTYLPAGDLTVDFTEYVGWLGCRLSQLWECNFKGVLYGLLKILTDVLVFLGFFRMWLSATILALISWANGNMLVFSRFIGGQFNNLSISIQNGLISVRSVVLITSGGAGLWDVLLELVRQFGNVAGQFIDALREAIGPVTALLSQIFDGVFQIVMALIGLIGTLLIMLVQVLAGFVSEGIGLLVSVMQALLNGVNRAETSMPQVAAALPNCGDPNSPLIGLCIGLNLLEKELMSGPAMILVPALFGLSVINQLLWAAGKVLSVFGGGDD